MFLQCICIIICIVYGVKVKRGPDGPNIALKNKDLSTHIKHNVSLFVICKLIAQQQPPILFACGFLPCVICFLG